MCRCLHSVRYTTGKYDTTTRPLGSCRAVGICFPRRASHDRQPYKGAPVRRWYPVQGLFAQCCLEYHQSRCPTSGICYLPGPSGAWMFVSTRNSQTPAERGKKTPSISARFPVPGSQAKALRSCVSGHQPSGLPVSAQPTKSSLS